MANRWFTQFMYTLHKKPALIDCNFVVDSTNANGLGVSSLKGPGVANVFMHSTAAFTGTSHTSTLIDSIASTSGLAAGMPVQGSGIPAGTKIASVVNATSITLSAATSTSTTGSITYQAIGSPNPAAGFIYVQLQDMYNRYYGKFDGLVSPTVSNTTAITSGLTIGQAYVITVLGTTTTAEWNSIGVPTGTIPAVGISFIATATGTGGGHTGKVGIPSASGISLIEAVGNSNLQLLSSGAQILGGYSSSYPYLIYQCLSPTFSGSALAAHSHALLLKDAAVVDGATTRVNAGTNLLGANTGSSITVAGGGANGGVQTASAGTPAGTIGYAATAPADGSLLNLTFYFSNSFLQAAGE